MKFNLRGILPGIISSLLLGLVLFGILPGYFIYGISLSFAYGSAKWGEKKYAIVNFVLFLLLASLFFGFRIDLVEIYLLAIYGILLGQGFYQQRSAALIFVPSTIFLYGSTLLMIVLQRRFLGVDMLSNMEELYLKQLATNFQDAGMIAQLKLILSEYGSTLLFLVTVFQNLLICWIVQGVLKLAKLPSRFKLEEFRLQGMGTLQLAGLFLFAYLGASILGLSTRIAMMSLLIFLCAFYFVQGISLLIYALKKKQRGAIFIAVLVVLAATLPFAQLFLVIMGMIDQFRDFRKLEQKS